MVKALQDERLLFMRVAHDDRNLYTRLDTALARIPVAEPTVEQCGGVIAPLACDSSGVPRSVYLYARTPITDDDAACLAKLVLPSELVARAEGGAIRVCAQRVRYELERLCILRHRRLDALVHYDADGDGLLDEVDLRRALSVLYPLADNVHALVEALLQFVCSAEEASARVKADDDVRWNGAASRCPLERTRSRSLDPVPRLTKEQAADLMVLYSDSVAREMGADCLIRKYDSDSDALLSAEDLLRLLEELTPEAQVDRSDVEWLLAEVDVHRTGKLGRVEVAELVRLWRQALADEPPPGLGKQAARCAGSAWERHGEHDSVACILL